VVCAQTAVWSTAMTTQTPEQRMLSILLMILLAVLAVAGTVRLLMAWF
jgi:hypothetical protein